MYNDFFGFREPPFSIAPDPRYLYLSERHKEALAHLMYGIEGQGGFIVITGEVGTGKTTVSRCFIENVPDHVDISLILNPKLSARELLSSICDELGVAHPADDSLKQLIDRLNHYLLAAHGKGRHTVLMIDEAQNLSAEVLEQLRLLTNLETAEKKLLQIVLLGQPELQGILAQPNLRQLSQRITARYHLDALAKDEVSAYLRYRLSVAGHRGEIFSAAAVRKLFRVSRGIPRLINLVADRALLGAYSRSESQVDVAHVRQAAREVLGEAPAKSATDSRWRRYGPLLAGVLMAIALTAALFIPRPTADMADRPEQAPAAAGTIERFEPSDEPSTGVDEAGELQAQPVSFDPSVQGQDLRGAFDTLFGIWERQRPDRNEPSLCEYAQTVGLGCLHRQGNWRSLSRLDHPVILRLQTGTGEPAFITVRSLRGEQAVVADGGRQWQVPVSELDAYWYGEYTLLWRLPPYLGPESGQRPEDSEALWLSARLMQLIDRYTQSGEQRREIESLDQSAQIQWYQRQKGLEDDGVAGTMTLIQLSKDLDPDLPRLTDGDAG